MICWALRARAPDCQFAAFSPTFFLASYYQKCPSEHICWKSGHFPPRRVAQGQPKAPRKHLRFLWSDPSRSEELLGSGRGCSSLLKICHLKWLKKIQFLPTTRGLSITALFLCPSRLSGTHVRVRWKRELRWHNLSLIGLRCITISATKRRTE